MLPQPAKCPLCGGEIIVTRLECRSCESVIESRFTPASHPFAMLTAEQLAFLEVFVRNEGKLKRMEAEMHLSYPTLRNRLYAIIRAMGYEPGQQEREAPASGGPGEAERLEILAALEAGDITYQEAMQRLTGNAQ